MSDPYYSDDYVTLYHGDCLEIDAWLSADVLVTDPPYGMALSSGRGGHQGDLNIVNDGDTKARDAALEVWDGPALVFGRWSIARPEQTVALLTWEKGEHVGMGNLRLPWKPNTEEVYVLGVWPDRTVRRGGSVIRCLAIAGTVAAAHEGRNHPTEKPLGLMSELIGSCPSGVITDPFAGSGSTLVAAKQLGRKAIGIELDERYCEIAAKRLAQGVLDFG
ncbi:MAG: DNA methyltransferase [Aquihabitans sp.]